MKFSALIERVRARDVAVEGIQAGRDPEVLRVCDDSRKVRPGDLFVARGGTKADGAQFIADAIARGAVAVVSGQWSAASGQMEVAAARVADTNLACALLAHEAAGNPTAGMKVIGVTGTKGKTTVAYLLRSVLRAAGGAVGMIGTVEIDDGGRGGEGGVPAEMTTPGSAELVELFVRMKNNGVTHCVMEVSSHALHQHRVAGIDFAVGIFTNLTGDHLDYHKTMEEYAAAKAMLFEGLRPDATAVVNGDDAWVGRMVRGSRCRVVACRLRPEQPSAGEWTGRVGTMTSSSMVLSLHGPAGQEYSLKTPLVGRHNAYNLLEVVAAAEALGVERSAILTTLEHATGAPGRLQRVQINGHPLPFQVFVDYAHTHDALQNVLSALRQTMTDAGSRGRLLCVFGCGGDRDRTKRPKMGRIAQDLADRVFVTSDNPRTEAAGAIIEEICAGFSAGWKDGGKVTVEPDRRAAIRAAIAAADGGDVVLIAGKGHENYQIIGTTKHHFDDVEEATAALTARGL